MEAMQTHNLMMIAKVNVLVHHVPKYARLTAVRLGPTSEQVLESQHALFNIFYHRFEVNCTKSSVFRELLLNAVLHHNSRYLSIAD